MSDISRPPEYESLPLKLATHYRAYGITAAASIAAVVGGVLWLVISYLSVSFSPTDSSLSLGICIIVILTGMVIVGTVTYDVVQRIAAKTELAEMLTNFSLQDYDTMRALVDRGQGLGVFRYLAHNENKNIFRWMRLNDFLSSEPLGRLASQALLQRSRLGRLKYLDEAISKAKTIWQPPTHGLG